MVLPSLELSLSVVGNIEGSTYPSMLEQYKETRHGSPGILGENHANKDGIMVNDTCHAEWDAILEKMIFLFLEADEETCLQEEPLRG